VIKVHAACFRCHLFHLIVTGANRGGWRVLLVFKKLFLWYATNVVHAFVFVDKTFEGDVEESNNQGIYLSKFTRAMTSCAMLRCLVIDTSSYQVLLVVRNCLHLQRAERAPFNNCFSTKHLIVKSFA